MAAGTGAISAASCGTCWNTSTGTAKASGIVTATMNSTCSSGSRNRRKKLRRVLRTVQ